MKIGYISDFHTEYMAASTREDMDKVRALLEESLPPPGCFDVLIAAGDMGYSEWIIDLLAMIAEICGCKVLYTPGNHEFYDCDVNYTYQDALDGMRKSAESYKDVVFLHNDSIEFHDSQVSIWMSPFYTDFSLDVPLNSMRELRNRIADYNWTTYKMYDGRVRKILPEDHRDLCLKAQKSLEEWIVTVEEMQYTPIIATHWGPSRLSAHGGFPDTDTLASYFISTYLDTNHQKFPSGTVWIHGHTHWNVDYQIGNVRVTSNQLGYRKSRSHWEQVCAQSFNPLKYLEV